jgi:hypothetical protein
MSMRPKGIPMPRPMASDLGLGSFEGLEELTDEGAAVAVGVEVELGIGVGFVEVETVPVGAEELVGNRDWLGRSTIWPTGTLKKLPFW